MDLTNVLTFKYPGARFFLRGNEYKGLEWHDTEIPKPTKDEILEASREFDAHLEKTEYKRLRALAYPSPQDQLDIMYNQGFEGWFNHLRSIKMKYPSPYKDKEPELKNVMEELEKRITTVETNAGTDLTRMKQEMADLQAAIIDTKGAIYAIKGFMMEIPGILKQLEQIQATLNPEKESR